MATELSKDEYIKELSNAIISLMYEVAEMRKEIQNLIDISTSNPEVENAK